MAEYYEEHITARSFFIYQRYDEEFFSKMNAILSEYFDIKAADPTFSEELWARVMELYGNEQLVDETCIFDDPA